MLYLSNIPKYIQKKSNNVLTDISSKNVLPSKEFLKNHKDTIFVQLTNKNNIYNNRTFKEGLNESNKIDLCFYEYSKIGKYIEFKGKPLVYIRKLVLPKEASVQICKNKFKTNKFILSKPRHIWNNIELSKEICLQNPIGIKYAHFLPEDLYFKIIKIHKKNPKVISYIKTPTPDMYLASVLANGLALKYIPPIHQTDVICSEAVKNDITAFAFIDKYIIDECNEYIDAYLDNTLEKIREREKEVYDNEFYKN